MSDPAAPAPLTPPADPAALHGAGGASGALQPVRVWDLPTRLFHWLLLVAVVGLVVTGKVGGGALVWHFRLGMLVLVLLGFRLVWGLVGGRWSRFASFLWSPAAVLRYLRGTPRPGEHFDVGHNPLGAGSVFALLAVLLAQLGTGLIADDEIATTGPLNKLVESTTGLAATAWHKGWGQWLLFGLVGLHVAAIVLYRLRGKNLVTPMLTGDKPLPADAGIPPATDNGRSRLLALVVVALWVAVAGWVFRQG